MTFNLILFLSLSIVVGGGVFYLIKLGRDAALTKKVIQKNKQIQERYYKLEKIENEKTKILNELHSIKSGSIGYKRILSDIRSKWVSKN